MLNTIFHVIATALYTATIGLVVRRTFITTVAGLLFAIHPIHTEAVAGIVGRADVLCGIFYLLAFLTFIKYSSTTTTKGCIKYVWLSLTFILVTASTLSKEIGITVLGVCATYYIFYYSHLTLQDLKQRKTSKVGNICLSFMILFCSTWLRLKERISILDRPTDAHDITYRYSLLPGCIEYDAYYLHSPSDTNWKKTTLYVSPYQFV